MHNSSSGSEYDLLSLNSYSTHTDVPLRQISEQGGCKNWLGRVVKLCPGGYYDNTTYMAVQAIAFTVGAIFFAAVLLGAIWRDSMSIELKILFSVVGFSGIVCSGLTFLGSHILYKEQPLPEVRHSV